MIDIIHLHNHSHYSVLDGLSKVEDIVTRAKAIKAPAVAITDHASITAMPELFKYAENAGVKPIIGCEFYVAELEHGVKGEGRYHLTVLAKSWNGVQSIMGKLTTANRQFYYRPRLTFEQIYDFQDCIIMSACSGGVLAHEDWVNIVHKLRTTYHDDFYLEIMPHVINYDGKGDAQEVINQRALAFHDEWKVKLVATNDAHYVNQDDFHTHEILLALQTGKQWDDPKRWSWVKPDFYMRDLSQMVEAFKTNAPYIPIEAVGDALRNTIEVADKCDVAMPKFEVHLPSIYPNDEGAFATLIVDGWHCKLGGLSESELDVYHNRLVYEVEVVRRLGVMRYFLMVDDIIRNARANGIAVGPGRGSAAGSLICYLMDITQVDPIKHGLFFERFLNPERIDLPDIDVDFQDDRRSEVFEYIRTKYGPEYTANISTVTQLSIVSAFRDVARTFGVNILNVNALSKLIEDEESFTKEPELVRFVNASKGNAAIVEQAKKLVGTIRSSGVHPCGYIVSSQPLHTVSALERRKDAQVVNWDMRLCETFGLLKMDVLGLSTLTILNTAKNMIKKTRGVDIDFTKIPLNDPKTLEAFSNGEGMGVFQFENSGMQGLLRAIGANTFEAITDATALFRPGSLDSGETERYIQVAQGHKYEEYVCEQLRPILSPTKGIMVYQEQIMRIFNELGGFSWAEADKMRKIIGKKLGKDEFNKHKAHFIAGCGSNGIDEAVSEVIFEKMAEFAKYSFNLSHAVSYTMISFWTMFIKVHYTTEFFAAHLTHRHDDKVAEIVKDVKRMGVTILKPDINLSTLQYEIADSAPNTILAPLTIIKGIGRKSAEAILDARESRVFISEDDFRTRVSARACNSKHLEILKRAGAFEPLGIRNPSQQEREKDYAELLPIFDELPTITKRGADIDMAGIEALYGDIGFCAKNNGKDLMMPSTGPRPYIMVINNAVKSETKHLTNKGTKYFLSVAERRGVPAAAFYYTGAVKCNHSGKDASKQCAGTCMDFLRAEIKLVKPKLIIVFASNVLGMFTSDRKPTMGKLNGQVTYNKDFDCYVLFSYSPQYAFYNEDKVGPQFDTAMNKLGEILF